MALSREVFKRSHFSFHVVDTDPPKLVYEVVVRVTPPGYPWRTTAPSARVTLELEGEQRPYTVEATGITDYSDIGHHPTLKKLARDWFMRRYGGLFSSGVR